MSDELSTHVILTHLEYIRVAIDEIKANERDLGSRVNVNERAIGILQWAVGLAGSASLAAIVAYLYRAFQ